MVGEVPGVLWTPVGPARPRPLVLLGHGGGQHKAAPGMVGRARRFAADGFAVAAIDAPGHGDRPRTDREQSFSSGLADRSATGEPVATHVADYHTAVAEQAVGDWKAVLDALQGVVGPTAGSATGASRSGQRSGCRSSRPTPGSTRRSSGSSSREMVPVRAARVSIPLEFLVQWDDELVPRQSALDLFDALASTEKSLHANPGPHGGVPRFEVGQRGQGWGGALLLQKAVLCDLL